MRHLSSFLLYIGVCYYFPMKGAEISPVFLQSEWNSRIPSKYSIPTKIIALDQKSIEYLTSDDTNPNLQQFQHQKYVETTIKELGGAVFAKVANRSAKDRSHLQRKVMSVQSLIMLVKFSEYLTEALCEESSGSILVLRRYIDELESGNDQFRVYVVENRLVGICQKDTSFLGSSPTINQLSAIETCKQQIEASLFSKESQSFVLDLYCSPNGKEIKIMSIQPFHIHGLSLFTEQQLMQHYAKQKPKPLVKIVETQSQLKQTDLSDYRPGLELKHLKNVKEWVDFMQSQDHN